MALGWATASAMPESASCAVPGCELLHAVALGNAGHLSRTVATVVPCLELVSVGIIMQ